MLRSFIIVAQLLAVVHGAYLCTDTCTFRNDYFCDDGGEYASYSVCEFGTDCGDCGNRFTWLTPLPPPPSPPRAAGYVASPATPPPPGKTESGGAGATLKCTNEVDRCKYINDGICDDGGPGSRFNECTLGLDCNDCGGENGTGFGLRVSPAQIEGEYYRGLDTKLNRTTCDSMAITIFGTARDTTLNTDYVQSLGFTESTCLSSDGANNTLSGVNLHSDDLPYSRELVTLTLVVLFLGTIIVILFLYAVCVMHAQAHFDLFTSEQMFIDNAETLRARKKEWKNGKPFFSKERRVAAWHKVCTAEKIAFINWAKFWEALMSAEYHAMLGGDGRDVSRNPRYANSVRAIDEGIYIIKLISRPFTILKLRIVKLKNDQVEEEDKKGVLDKVLSMRCVYPLLRLCCTPKDKASSKESVEEESEGSFDNCAKSSSWRAFKAVVPFVVTWVVMGIAIVIVPHTSLNKIHEATSCVFKSCQSSGYNSKADEFECGAAKSAGVMQPSFWGDLIDIVQIITTLTLIILLAEMKETFQGLNNVAEDGVITQSKQAIAQAGEMKLAFVQIIAGVFSLATIMTAGGEYNRSCLLAVIPRSFDGVDTLTLLKPERKEWLVLIIGMVRATMGNVALVTVGIALKNVQLKILNNFASMEAFSVDISYAISELTRQVITDTTADKHLKLLQSCVPSGLKWVRVKDTSGAVLTEETIKANGHKLKHAKLEKKLKELLEKDVKWWNSDKNLHRSSGSVKNLHIKMDEGGKEQSRLATLNLTEDELKSTLGDEELKSTLGDDFTLKMSHYVEVDDGPVKSYFKPASSGLEFVIDGDVKPSEKVRLLEYLYSEKATVASSVRNSKQVKTYSLIFTAVLLLYYSIVIIVCCSYGAAFMGLPFFLWCVIFIGWMPVINYLTNVTTAGLSIPDRTKLETALSVARFVVMLRALIVVMQGILLVNVPTSPTKGYNVAYTYTYLSYFTVGDAVEKLTVLLTFDLPGFFDFSINPLPKVLSGVVVAVEIVMAMGKDDVGRMPELFGRRCVYFWRFVTKHKKRIKKALSCITTLIGMGENWEETLEKAKGEMDFDKIQEHVKKKVKEHVEKVAEPIEIIAEPSDMMMTFGREEHPEFMEVTVAQMNLDEAKVLLSEKVDALDNTTFYSLMEGKQPGDFYFKTADGNEDNELVKLLNDVKLAETEQTLKNSNNDKKKNMLTLKQMLVEQAEKYAGRLKEAKEAKDKVLHFVATEPVATDDVANALEESEKTSGEDRIQMIAEAMLRAIHAKRVKMERAEQFIASVNTNKPFPKLPTKNLFKKPFSNKVGQDQEASTATREPPA